MKRIGWLLLASVALMASQAATKPVKQAEPDKKIHPQEHKKEPKVPPTQTFRQQPGFKPAYYPRGTIATH